MNTLYRGFLIAMILLVLLGAAIFVVGAIQHGNRPRTPGASGGTIRFDSVQQVTRHV